jgi:hypothetical protein
MAKAIRGALASDDALVGLGEEPRFRVRKLPTGKSMPADLDPKCSSAECFSRSLIGTRDRPSCPSANNPPLHRNERRGQLGLEKLTPPAMQAR